jgi:hypothetical protein
MIRGLALLTVMVGVGAQDPTGTEPGQVLPGPFNAYVVFGGPRQQASEKVQTEERRNFADPTRAGKHHDLVTRYGLDPVVAVFTRAAPPAEDAPLAQLLKSLDAAVQKNRDARLHAFAVFLRLRQEFLLDDTRIPQARAIEQFATRLDLKEVPLALTQAENERTKAYNLAAEAETTVIVYENLKVRAKFTFTADKPLDDAALKAIEAEIQKTVKK